MQKGDVVDGGWEDGRRDDGDAAIGTNYFLKDLCQNISSY